MKYFKEETLLKKDLNEQKEYSKTHDYDRPLFRNKIWIFNLFLEHSPKILLKDWTRLKQKIRRDPCVESNNCYLLIRYIHAE
jgi:hypothetical protein